MMKFRPLILLVALAACANTPCTAQDVANSESFEQAFTGALISSASTGFCADQREETPVYDALSTRLGSAAQIATQQGLSAKIERAQTAATDYMASVLLVCTPEDWEPGLEEFVEAIDRVEETLGE